MGVVAQTTQQAMRIASLIDGTALGGVVVSVMGERCNTRLRVGFVSTFATPTCVSSIVRGMSTTTPQSPHPHQHRRIRRRHVHRIRLFVCYCDWRQ